MTRTRGGIYLRNRSALGRLSNGVRIKTNGVLLVGRKTNPAYRPEACGAHWNRLGDGRSAERHDPQAGNNREQFGHEGISERRRAIVR
jgi:hypothetical protein